MNKCFPITRKFSGFIAVVTGLILSSFAGAAAAIQISVPLRFEVSLLREAIIKQIYNEPGETATILNDGTGCRFLVIRQPQISVSEGRLKITSAGTARIGQVVKNKCVFPLDWKGFLEIFEQPQFDPNTNKLSFRVVDSNIYDEQHKKKFLSGKLWDLVKAHVHPRLAVFSIDFSQPVNELRALLPLLLPGSREEIQRLLATVRIDQLQLQKETIDLTLVLNVEQRLPQPITAPEPALTPEEIERWNQSWQRWDAFITFIAKHLARDNSDAAKMTLSEVLLDMRYDLLEVLEPSKPGEPDPVPKLFVKTWDRLRPVVQKLAEGAPGESILHYVSFISGADALAALVKAGPGIGLEISADSLRSLARLLVMDSKEDPVAYTTDVDPELRRMLGFGMVLPPPKIDPEVDLEANQEDRMQRTVTRYDRHLFVRIHAWLFPEVSAEFNHDIVAKLNHWVPAKDELKSYLPLVRDLLQDIGEKTSAAGNLDSRYYLLFRTTAVATAWQESCWRQFIRKGNKIVPLKSRIGSLGLMQVNQHVWRGVYDIKGLKGDIAYNSRAGCEILLHYLKDYAIAQGEDQDGFDNLARASYSVYNGGPGQLSRYRSHNTKSSLKKADDSWWEKYQEVKNGNEMNVAECYK
jgi:hypothetical protein